jgi:formate/nitrite transporter FocA (FNT family)
MAEQAHVELDADEEQEVEERGLPAPHVVFETIRSEGERELARATSALLFSGLAAGLSMGFSLIATATLHARLPDAPWRPLVESFGYSTGFVAVILGRQQLFTENTLTGVLPALVAFNARVLLKLARLWALVLAANLTGCAIVAFALAATPIVPPEHRAAFAAIASPELALPPLTAFARAIFAGWLVALMVWLLPASEGGAKPLIVIGLTYLIAICGFPHIIAGSVDAFYQIFRGDATLAGALTSFFIPTLCGNIAGGVVIVSILGFGQVFEDHIAPGGPPRTGARPRGSRASG